MLPARPSVCSRLCCRASASPDFSLVALEQLWLAAAEHDPAIGLHLFAQFSPQDWHVLAHLCLFCADVAEASRCWARYASLAADSDQLRVVEEAEGMGVELQIDATPQLARFLAEHYMVMAVTQMRRGTGQPLLPLRVQFRHARPAYQEQYRPWFGERVEFDAPYNRLLFDRATQALPMLGRRQRAPGAGAGAAGEPGKHRRSPAPEPAHPAPAPGGTGAELSPAARPGARRAGTAA